MDDAPRRVREVIVHAREQRRDFFRLLGRHSASMVRVPYGRVSQIRNDPPIRGRNDVVTQPSLPTIGFDEPSQLHRYLSHIARSATVAKFGDRKSTRLTPVTNAHLVCRLLLEKKKN